MESLDEFGHIKNIFLHRYKTLIRCHKCDKWISDVENMYSIFEVQPDLKNEQLEKFKKYDTNTTVSMKQFLTKQSSFVDKNYICSVCKNADEKYTIHCLVMVPEVLVVLSKKYTANKKLNIFTDFPYQLTFDGKDGDTLVYEAVSQIEHSGELNGGHYWAISKRKNGWFTLNDNNINSTKFKPTNNTYIVFYHLK
jgi:ubiquitin C-terminal hydrolase